MDKQIAPEKFNKQCAAVLAKYVDMQDGLVWSRNGLEKVTFICMNKTNPIYRDGCHFLRVAGTDCLLLHCALTYIEPDRKASQERKFTFQGISLQFYHGADTCFCRAEWDVKDKAEKLMHPQPHWHWGVKHSASILDADITDEDSGFLTENSAFDGARKPKINFTELHYAMSSKWLEKGEDYLIFSFHNLTKWMENALVMVIDQYSYQANKKGFVSVKR